MKRSAILLMGIALLGLGACASKEQLLVQDVLGPYECVSLCTRVDLTAQDTNVVTNGDETIFVTKAVDWKKGYVLIGDREVYINPDSSFTLSSPDYFFSGEFTSIGQLIFSESTVNRENNTRLDCEIVGYRK